MVLPGLTVLNLYRLTGTPAAFGTAIAALAARVQTQGEPGILAYRFFVNDTDGTARAVIDYATPQAWIGHHDRAMPWPEMRALQAVARLEEVTFLGEVTPEIRAWIAASGLRAGLREGYRAAAGFRRHPAPG